MIHLFVSERSPLFAHIIMVNPAAKSFAIANQNQAVTYREMADY